ncbi:MULTISPECIES: glycoside hydrolase family 28 protein [Lactobacillaceae]|uniref:glycoside hydrolase family 28 protein n=1 Tax=Lactobacillaceae TaxID=33958 RepID=UPI00145788DC|nr:glycosyl hydrolase family 28 protein [Lactobacillus sp. HBUAS51381]NLR09210.1 polygalacturonase [Lactobacillus sp. HBUAS51381]
MKINILDTAEYAEIKMNATATIQAAIDQCAAAAGGEVTIPSGQYIIDGLQLKTGVTLSLEADAILQGSGHETRYTHRPGPFELNRNQTPISALIYAKGQRNIGITGEGQIDGNYRAFIYPDQTAAVHLKSYKYPRPMTIYFENCTNVTLQQLTITDAPFWTIHLVGCHNTEISHIAIHNELRMPNTDGIDVDRSQNTYIHDCEIITGDDAICPKCTEETAQYGNCTDLLVENCFLKTQSAAVKFGSSSFGNFENCQFRHLTIKDTNRGLAFQLRDPGSASNIRFEDITIATKPYSQEWWGAGEPIYITLLPRDATTDLSQQTIRNVIFKNITCEADNGILVAADVPAALNQITFEDVTLTLRHNVETPVAFDLRPWQGAAKIYRPLRLVTNLAGADLTFRNVQGRFPNRLTVTLP